MPKTLDEEFQEYVADVFGTINHDSQQYRSLKMAFFAGVGVAVRTVLASFEPIVAESIEFADAINSAEGTVQ